MPCMLPNFRTGSPFSAFDTEVSYPACFRTSVPEAHFRRLIRKFKPCKCSGKHPAILYMVWIVKSTLCSISATMKNRVPIGLCFINGGDGMLSEFALPLDFTLLSACIFLNCRPEWRPFRISERVPYRSVSIAFSEHEKRPEIIWISSPNYGGDGVLIKIAQPVAITTSQQSITLITDHFGDQIVGLIKSCIGRFLSSQ